MHLKFQPSLLLENGSSKSYCRETRNNAEVAIRVGGCGAQRRLGKSDGMEIKGPRIEAEEEEEEASEKAGSVWIP